MAESKRAGVRLQVVLGSALLLSLTTPAVAQDRQTGTLVPQASSSAMVEEAGGVRRSTRAPAVSGAAARRAANEVHDTMRRYAGCLVNGTDNSRQRNNVASFLKVAPGAPEANALARRVAQPNCLYAVPAASILLRYDAQTLRGLLFRELYLDRERTQPKAGAIRQAVGVLPPPVGGGSFVAGQRFAECVVRRDPTAADALMRAPVGSPEQDAVVRTVSSELAACLQQNLTLQMSRIVLEGMLAEALYRRADDDATAALTKPTLQPQPVTVGQK